MMSGIEPGGAGSQGDSLVNFMQATQVVLSMTPVPGLAACAVIAQEIYQLIKRVQLRKKEVDSLCAYCGHVIHIIDRNYDPVKKDTFTAAVDELSKTMELIKLDVQRWERYNKALSFYKNTDILTACSQYKDQINQCIGMLSLAQVMKQHNWNERFMEARNEDAEKIDEILQKSREQQEQMKLLMDMVTKKNTNTGQDEVAKAREEVYRMRNPRKDTFVLPPADMTGEVAKFGERPVHAGTMYDIWRGIYLDSKIVSMKAFRGINPRQKDMDRLNRQVDIWRSLNHPNILTLYGTCPLDRTTNAPICFISPWLKNRDAVTYLNNNRQADRLRIIHDIAKGLKYLHSISIIHGGLQGSNVLINDSGSAVLSDFSLSKALVDGSTNFTQSNGLNAALRWMAPEQHTLDAITVQTDVYSFAMTTLQILSGHIPFHKTRAMAMLVMGIAMKTLKPVRDDYPSPLITENIWTLLACCWDEPERRPTMDFIIDVIETERKIRGWEPEEQPMEIESESPF